MRWNATVTLHGNSERYQDDAGYWHEGELEERTVFCNVMKYGSLFMANLRSNDVRMLNNNLKVDVGQMPEIQIQVRSEDYLGEPLATYNGVEYEVLYATLAGELSILGLVKRIGNLIGEADV